jgi:hypothetical protein
MEMFLAIAIFSVALSVLSYAYYRVNLLEVLSKKEEKQVMERASSYNLLRDCMNYLYFDSQKSKHFFFSENSRLFFSFNNGIDRDIHFSSIVKSCLYVNQNKELVLEISPDPIKFNQVNQSRKYILMKDIEGLSFEFFYIENKFINTESKTKPLIGYQEVWKIDYDTLPHSFKIKAKKINKDKIAIVEFPFVLCIS